MARLVRVIPDVDPGVRRVRAGSSFRYVYASGRPVGDRVRQRIVDLVIPPAWHDVWIARNPRAHIQAVGTDDAGRRQYIYHPEWRQRRDRGKFGRALALAEALPHARSRVTKALRNDDESREVALAVAFRLLDDVAPRIGSARYLTRHGSRGLTTLRRRDVAVRGSVVSFSFPGKSGQQVQLEADDPELAAVLSRLSTGVGRSALLWHRRGRRQVAVKPAEVNEYILTLTGGRFTAKDFRTLHGTICAAEALAHIGPVDSGRERREAERQAVQSAAQALGNTPAVARGSYIDPRVFTRYAKGSTLDTTVSAETAIRRLLLPHEPSRG